MRPCERLGRRQRWYLQPEERRCVVGQDAPLVGGRDAGILEELADRVAAAIEVRIVGGEQDLAGAEALHRQRSEERRVGKECRL